MIVNRLRPSLTSAEVDALEVGDIVRDIPGNLHHIVAFVDGKYGESLAVLAWWHARHQCWKYRVAGYEELCILFTPKKMPA